MEREEIALCFQNLSDDLEPHNPFKHLRIRRMLWIASNLRLLSGEKKTLCLKNATSYTLVSLG